MSGYFDLYTTTAHPTDEADIFRHWLIARLNDTELTDEESGNTTGQQ
jgi:hypothetical protein